MILETIDLYNYNGLQNNLPNGGKLNVYCRSASPEMSNKLRPAVLIFPGGGYGFLSDRENEPIVLEFVRAGYCAFVLSYSIHTPYPDPLNQALMAVGYIKQNAQKYGIDANKIVAIGFSAGGHLAALLATATKQEVDSVPNGAKPNAVVLSYPVITMGEFTNEGTKNVITDNGKINPDYLSVENRVDCNSAPAFIWHTFEDDCVPIENSLLLASAYRKANVPFALHIFEKGCHGLSICNGEVNAQLPIDLQYNHVGKWFDLALDWLHSRGFALKTIL